MRTSSRRATEAAEAAGGPTQPECCPTLPTLPHPASLNPVKPVQQFLSEIVSLMQLHFVFSDLKEILMLIIKGMCSNTKRLMPGGCNLISSSVFNILPGLSVQGWVGWLVAHLFFP